LPALQERMKKWKRRSFKNCGKRRILAAPEPNGLGEGS
jgi:hypothetical protein